MVDTGSGRRDEHERAGMDAARALARLENLDAILKRAMHEVSRAITSLDSFENTARHVFDACKAATGAEAGYVALLSADGQENVVLFLDAGGLPCSVDPSLPMPIRGLRAGAYHEKRAVFENQFLQSPWTAFLPEGHVEMRNVMFAPMIINDQVKGIIGLANKAGEFTEEDAEIAQVYANMATIALQSSYMVEQLQKGTIDLTIANARANFLNDLMVHDMSNILQVLHNLVMLLDVKLKRGDDHNAIVVQASKIGDQLARGTDLITNVRKMASFRSTGEDRSTIDLAGVVERGFDTIRSWFPSRSIATTLHVEASDTMVLASGMIHDVVENLLVNAVTHNASQAIEITATISDGEIDHVPALLLAVTDNGKGIEDARKDAIFQRREQGRDIPSVRAGMGIGLSIVKQIVGLFKGRIWVEDACPGEPSRGSTFKVVLPRKGH